MGLILLAKPPRVHPPRKPAGTDKATRTRGALVGQPGCTSLFGGDRTREQTGGTHGRFRDVLTLQLQLVVLAAGTAALAVWSL